MDFLKLKLNLQFFSADETGGADTKTDDTKTDETDPEKKTDDAKKDETKADEKKFTQADIDAAVKSRVTRLERDKQEAVEEAKKLAKMNADEKKDYELEKLQKENERLKQNENRYSLGKEATKMLADSGIIADDETLEFVVREDAETTKVAVQSFSALVEKKVDEGVKEALKGKSPKTSVGAGGTITKESIMAIKDGSQRIRAIQDNPHLFK